MTSPQAGGAAIWRRWAGAIALFAALAAPAVADEPAQPAGEPTQAAAEADEKAPDPDESVQADGDTTPAAEKPEGSDTAAALGAGSGVRVQSICTNCNQANLTVNGVTGSEHILVSVDGVPAVGGLGTVYSLMQWPGELVGWSHVARGPGSVLSGSGGMGGTIEMHSSARTSDQRAYLDMRVGDWGSRQLRIGGSDRWGPVGALVLLQGIQQHAVDANGDSKEWDGGNEVAAFERLTAHGIFDFHLTPHQVLTLHGLSYGETQDDGPGRPTASFAHPDDSYFGDEDVRLNWQRAGLSWEWEAPKGINVVADLAWSRRFQAQVAPLFPGGEPEPYLRVHDERVHSRVNAAIPLGTSGLLTVGTGYQKLHLRVFNFESINVQWITDGLEHFETYAEWSQEVGSRWNYSVGGRYDDFVVYGWTTPRNSTRTHDPDLPSSYFLPRGQFHFKPSSNVTIGFATGRFAVGPTPVVEKTCCGAQYERSRELTPERSWSYQSSVEWHPTPDMRVTGTIYRTDFHDYIQRIVSQSTFFIPRYANRNVLRARVQGIDIVHDMRFAENRWNVGWTYGYSDSQDGDGAWLLYLPRQTASAYVRFDLPGRGTKVNFDARWQGPVRHFDLPAIPAPVSGPLIGYRLSDSFATADVSFEQRLGKKGWAVEGGVSNLTDYVQEDLSLKDANANGYRDQFERCADWGPITGRYIWAGMRFVR